MSKLGQGAPVVHAPSLQSIQMRRKSIEAMLARRRNSNRKTSLPNVEEAVWKACVVRTYQKPLVEVGVEDTGRAKEAGPAPAKITLKHVRVRGRSPEPLGPGESVD